MSSIKVGSIGKIAHFKDDLIAGKLMTMGILPGSMVRVIRKAPFKGGLYLKIDGYNIALREQEAENIVMTLNA